MSQQDEPITPSADASDISHIVLLIAMEAEAKPLLESYKLVILYFVHYIRASNTNI